jgi:hypothetical protein
MRPTSPGDWRLSELHYELEQNLGADPDAFVDVAAFKTAMTRAERCVARIESPEFVPQGTGFLIAPDLLITNNHVRSDARNTGKNAFDLDPSLVKVRFGHVAGARISSRVYGLHKDWLLDSSPEGELDFCIVRLSESAGEDNIGDGATSPVRGWISASESSPVENQVLHILQHPLGQPLKHAAGQLVGSSGDWVGYAVNTDHGSSGSPVFDCRWQCVALHSRAGKGINRGVCFRAVLRVLSSELRALVQQAAPAVPAEYEEVAMIATEPGVSIDLSQFPPAQVQAIANAMLQHMTSAASRGRPVSFELTVGGGRHLRCVPSDLARDAYHRQALEGDLRLLQTRTEVLQDVQNILAMYPTSPDAPGNRIRVKSLSGEIKANDATIRERLEGMVDEFRLTRRERV